MSPHLLAAPDKFRGTASAGEIARAVGSAARARGWTADEAPMADGGEGTLDALDAALGDVPGADVRRSLVAGPLGSPVVAEWRLFEGGLPLPGGGAPDVTPTTAPGGAPGAAPTAAPGVMPGAAPTAAPGVMPGAAPTAVIESARAAGRSLLAAPEGDDPLRATTAGVGELVVAAIAAGARLVVVTTGGSATTDGGAGALEVIRAAGGLGGARLVATYDVRTRFRQAAALFGPQKGATPAQVVQLTHRLEELAEGYRRDAGVDLDALAGSGAAGGLAGGLAALGATLVSGFDFTAAVTGLDLRLAGADLVVTGEGRLDGASFEGKVVGGVIAAAGGRAPVLCVVGERDPRLQVDRPGVEVVSLVDAVGPERASRDTAAAVAEVVGARLAGVSVP